MRRESPACFHFRIRSQTSDTKPFPSYSPHKTHHIAPAAPCFRPPQAVCCPPERKVPSPSVQDVPSPPDPARAPYAPHRFRGRTPCRKSDTGKASLLIVPFCPCRCPSESFYYVYRKTAFPMQGIQRLIMYLQIGLPCAENRSSYSVMTFPSFKRASA